MLQLAVIAPPHAWPAHWALPQIEVQHHASLAAMDPDTRVDGVALVDPAPQEVPDLLERIEARSPLGAMATLIAGRADSTQTQDLLARHAFDGFVDLAWPERVAAAAVRIALAHVQLGRNVVDIQRVVIEQAHQQMTSLFELANHDGLTNLFNLRYFDDLMARQHDHSVRVGDRYALIFIDLDDLRELNTRFGHYGGSRALNELAGVLSASVRATDVAVRLGGDEFAVFLSGCDQAQGAEFARRLCATLHAHQFEVEGQRLSITVSCGVAAYPEDGIRYADVLKHADRALFSAKAQGKDRVVGFSPALWPPTSRLTQ